MPEVIWDKWQMQLQFLVVRQVLQLGGELHHRGSRRLAVGDFRRREDLPHPSARTRRAQKENPVITANYRIFLITTLFSVEVAGVEPSKIHTDNQQYIQTQKLAPTKTPRD